MLLDCIVSLTVDDNNIMDTCSSGYLACHIRYGQLVAIWLFQLLFLLLHANKKKS